MSDEEEDDIPDNLEVFDISAATVTFSRSKDTKRVTVSIRDPNGISEFKAFLILSLEVEKLERRLGISEPDASSH